MQYGSPFRPPTDDCQRRGLHGPRRQRSGCGWRRGAGLSGGQTAASRHGSPPPSARWPAARSRRSCGRYAQRLAPFPPTATKRRGRRGNPNPTAFPRHCIHAPPAAGARPHPQPPPMSLPGSSSGDWRPRTAVLGAGAGAGGLALDGADCAGAGGGAGEGSGSLRGRPPPPQGWQSALSTARRR